MNIKEVMKDVGSNRIKPLASADAVINNSSSGDTELCNTKDNRQPSADVMKTHAEIARMVQVQPKRTSYKAAYNFYLTVISQICIVLYAFVVVYFCLSGEFVFFTWHPLLMTIGWFILMTQAILILSKEEFLTRYGSHKLRVKLHWILQSIGAVMTTIGFFVIVWNKFNLNKYHFQTWHALFGLSAFVCFTLTLCTGASTLYSATLKSYVSPKWNKFLHVLLGVLTYLFGGFSLILTVYTKWFNRKSEESNFLFVYGIICVFTVITSTLIKPLRYLWTRVQNI